MSTNLSLRPVAGDRTAGGRTTANTMADPPSRRSGKSAKTASAAPQHGGTWCSRCSLDCCLSSLDDPDRLEYDYTHTPTTSDPTQYVDESIAQVRIRDRGEYYIDSYNDQPWSWTWGTHEANGTWFNSSDQAGSIMSCMVWLLMLYSAFTVTMLTVTHGIPPALGVLYNLLVALSLACHAKTSLTDPGSVPVSAIPTESARRLDKSHAMCGQCQTFKPALSHHCRICNRCISRMDHHCPWMNNCVGVANLKHFVLFLLYTWTCAALALTLFGWNYFFCNTEDCTFGPVVLLHLVRIMTLLALGAFLFTSSMLMNVTYGIMTGIGTIDRLKKKATNTVSTSDESPIALRDIFGIGGYHTWPFPMDPVFDDYDRVMGYCVPHRLDRERQLVDAVAAYHQQQQYDASVVSGTAGGTTTRRRNNRDPAVAMVGGDGLELPRCMNDMLPA